MEDELKCPVCKRLYTNPVLLACGHALCLFCARRVQVSGTGNTTQIGGLQDGSESHEDHTPDLQTTGGLLSDHDCLEVDAASVTSETDSGVVCRSRPGSYLGTPCVAVANPLLTRDRGQFVIVCSVCRKVTLLDDVRGPDGLPTSRVLEAVVEKYRESKQCPMLCQACSGEPPMEAREAVVFCEECKTFYCGECQEACHTQDVAHKSRRLGAAGEVRSLVGAKDQEPPKCMDHEGEVLKMYCCACKTLLCSVCQLTGHHEGHGVQATLAVYKTQKCELSQLLHTLSEKVRSSTELIHRLRLMQEHVQVNYQDFETCIAAQCDALIEALRQRKQQLLDGVKNERIRKENFLKERLTHCASRVQKTTGVLQFSIEVLKESDPTAFLQVSTSLIERVSDVYGSFSRSLELDQGLSADVELSLDDASALAKSIETLSLAPVKEPNAPYIVAEECRSENNTVTVVWSPAHDGSTASGYVLELDDGNKGNFREVYCGTQTLCMVEGLLFGRQYMARVKAYNKAGVSQYSSCVCLQTSYVAWFTFDPVTSHPDVLFSNDNLTVTSCSFDDRIVLGSVGLSSGVHYWELTIDRFDNNKDPAFGIALLDISKDKMLGKDKYGWSMYIDNTRSWFMHEGRHFDRTEGGISPGSTVGILLDLDRQNLSFYVNGEPHGGVINTGRYGVFYPAVSLNRNVQVTLTSGLEVPVDTDNEED